MRSEDPVATYQLRVGEIAERAEAARSQVAAIRPSVTSDDGAVTVSVTATGSLAGIEFGASARDLDLPELAAKIMRTAQQARVQAAEEAQQVLGALVGESGAAMDFVRSQLPALSEPVPEPPNRDFEDGFQGRGL
ncbi:YbaB/EbfC DNA-binding family protein [Jatrophihabitans sp. GAS493]|uniref:YbaB/EbfC family nucleoid-associated protein n=1 Tax=Jatrophihabitans sp. GAS493 TaxID=1907575 RepID=UPI000BB88F5D|nr:YbaB/EbfC family nucleoid-associated protein [Jatrophihabitans sp. GAS493]SOD72398.1 YbaB/EbfC DNA-binding family protein [Jatrophihabitans sp. GAS493]